MRRRSQDEREAMERWALAQYAENPLELSSSTTNEEQVLIPQKDPIPDVRDPQVQGKVEIFLNK